uniref:Uncharacterized protein n=1 Tax=viral metagenome TaxID=1070528 RepID=A0A6C0BMJ1_9ZZZZ
MPDQNFNNLTVGGVLVNRGRIVTPEAIIGDLNNDTLDTARSDNGLQFHNIQEAAKLNNHHNFLLSNLYTQIQSGAPIPPIPGGRTVTINNHTTSTTLDVYLTVGYPQASGPSLIGTLSPGSGTTTWNIPTTLGWNGNFTAFPQGSHPVSGATLAEFGFNQLWSGATPPLRDTFDISTVPPGIGTRCNDGPHSDCSELSRQSGFTTQQSYGYNVGIQIIPPTGGSLPSQTVTCTEANGDSPDSVGYPNDTAFPKQQTIELQAAPAGNYIVNFLDPVKHL